MSQSKLLSTEITSIQNQYVVVFAPTAVTTEPCEALGSTVIHADADDELRIGEIAKAVIWPPY